MTRAELLAAIRENVAEGEALRAADPATWQAEGCDDTLAELRDMVAALELEIGAVSAAEGD